MEAAVEKAEYMEGGIAIVAELEAEAEAEVDTDM